VGIDGADAAPLFEIKYNAANMADDNFDANNLLYPGLDAAMIVTLSNAAESLSDGLCRHTIDQ